MPYEIDRACSEIDRARAEVARAQESYSSGGSLRALNEAQRRLADAHAAMRETTGGNVPDKR